MMRQHGKGSIYETAKITPQTKLELAEDAWIGDFVFVNLEKLILGRGSQIGAFASLTGGGNVQVGQYTTIGYGVRVIAGTDTPEGRYMADRAPLSERRVVRGSIKIGDNCFVGANAVISVSKNHPLIEIEDNVVVGALSYVGEDVARDTVGWGTPFRPVKKRTVKA